MAIQSKITVGKVVHKIIIADRKHVVIVTQLAITFDDAQHRVNHVKKMVILM